MLAALAATALPALGATYYYVDWTSANLAQGTAAGVIALPDGSAVNVGFQVVNQDGSPGQLYGVQTSGGTNFWVPSSTYTSGEVTNPPPNGDIVQLAGSPGQTYVITLSKPVKNPIMAIVSLGLPGTPVVYKFTAFAPFAILSQGPGYWGSGSLSALTNTALSGEEGDGTIQFTGTFSTLGWTALAQDVWHGFTLGIRTDDASPPPSPPTVQTTAASGVTATGATLNSSVSSNGAATTVTFEYGPTMSYGSSASAAQSPLAASASAAAVSAAIGGLTCNRTYHFRVVLTNSAGTTTGADTTFTTAACAGGRAPGAPTGVTAAAGNAQATVGFTAPADDGGSAITGYTVTSSPAGGIDSAAGTTATTHKITGLANGVAYTFTAIAVNAFGTSVPSAPSNTVTPTASPVLNFQGLWWGKPAGTESGWGINFTHQGDVIFATWFTYDAAGKPWWLIAELRADGSNVFSGPVSTVKGLPFNTQPWDPTKMDETIVGTMTATFTDTKNGTLTYTVSGITQTKDITPQEFGTLPTCVYGASPADLALSYSYHDLWWASPPGTESGWGINLTHQNSIIFATWFTYDADGMPWWLIAELHMTGARVYSGDVATVQGVPFNASPWDTTKIVETPVGTMTITFADGNHAVIDYTVSGIHQTKNATRQLFGTLGTLCSDPDNSGGFVTMLVELAGRANRGEITSDAFISEYRTILAAIAGRTGAAGQLLPYLETEVLGRSLVTPNSAPAAGKFVDPRALAPGDFDVIKASAAHRLLQAAMEATVFRQTPDGAGDQVVAVDVEANIALSGVVVRVAVLDASTAGSIAAGTANQMLTLVATNPFAAYKQLLPALGQPIPAWLANVPICLTGCGPAALRYGGPMSGSALLTATYGLLSCTANASFSGTVTLDMTVSGVNIVSGTAAVDGTATVTDSTNPGLCPNGPYALTGSAPLTGTVSNMTATFMLGDVYPGTLNAALAGSSITGTISTVLIPGSPPLTANFTLNRL